MKTQRNVSYTGARFARRLSIWKIYLFLFKLLISRCFSDEFARNDHVDCGSGSTLTLI
jgi:hypothetical protein